MVDFSIWCMWILGQSFLQQEIGNHFLPINTIHIHKINLGGLNIYYLFFRLNINGEGLL